MAQDNIQEPDATVKVYAGTRYWRGEAKLVVLGERVNLNFAAPPQQHRSAEKSPAATLTPA